MWWNLVPVEQGQTRRVNSNHKTPKTIQESIDGVPPTAQVSGTRAQDFFFFFFEDSEAVIKIIMQDRSPHMRHVSRTHRVNLDWLLERITF